MLAIATARISSLSAAALLVASPIAFGQVFDPGPSDSSLFTNGVFNTPSDPTPDSLGDLQQLNVIDQGVVPASFFAGSGSEVNIDGGTVGDFFSAISQSEVNIAGGEVGSGFFAGSNSQINISGGFVGDGFIANPSSQVNISGGVIGDGFFAFPFSNINLVGESFSLDGSPISNLVLGESSTINDRDVALTGILTDGTPFRFTLNPDPITTNADFFATNATLTVTLVPEPGQLTIAIVAALGTSLLSCRERCCPC